MRNYIPKRNNLYKLPHDIYMQMFYLLRDYLRIKSELVKGNKVTYAQERISDAVNRTKNMLEYEYTKRSETYGQLDSYRAFFDYCYFSIMFARKTSELGASKSAWGLYKSKFAYILAKTLEMI